MIKGALEQVKGVTYSLRGFLGPFQGLLGPSNCSKLCQVTPINANISYMDLTLNPMYDLEHECGKIRGTELIMSDLQTDDEEDN